MKLKRVAEVLVIAWLFTTAMRGNAQSRYDWKTNLRCDGGCLRILTYAPEGDNGDAIYIVEFADRFELHLYSKSNGPHESRAYQCVNYFKATKRVAIVSNPARLIFRERIFSDALGRLSDPEFISMNSALKGFQL
ncbi:MAG TPA: hypothetical protein VEA59_00605 [Patescibacteria group bacterium]|nr:hypothetical protein [Patescibacteria group bacterium]